MISSNIHSVVCNGSHRISHKSLGYLGHTTYWQVCETLYTQGRVSQPAPAASHPSCDLLFIQDITYRAAPTETPGPRTTSWGSGCITLSSTASLRTSGPDGFPTHLLPEARPHDKELIVSPPQEFQVFLLVIKQTESR